MDDIIFINDLLVGCVNFTVLAFDIRVEGLTSTDEFTGRTIYCKCVRADQFINGTWSLT